MGYRQQVEHYSTPVRGAEPIGSATASALGRIHGRGMDGRTGRFTYGWPAMGTTGKFGGYVFPAQLFIGWRPDRAASGAIRPTPTGLPATQAPAGYNSALLSLLATMGKR